MTVKESIVRTVLPVGAILASIGIGFAGITSAQSATSSTNPATGVPMERGMMGERPAVMGKITAISGTTLTVDAVEGRNKGTQTATTYTVDASGATVQTSAEGAAPTVSSISALAVGDMVAIRGTVSGTSVTATEIMEGMSLHGMKGGRGGHGTHGTVSAVNGNTITITGDNGTTYTVDASAATVAKFVTSSVSDIKVGDSLDVKGTVSGTSVTAERIMTGMPPKQQ